MASSSSLDIRWATNAQSPPDATPPRTTSTSTHATVRHASVGEITPSFVRDDSPPPQSPRSPPPEDDASLAQSLDILGRLTQAYDHAVQTLTSHGLSIDHLDPTAARADAARVLNLPSPQPQAQAQSAPAPRPAPAPSAFQQVPRAAITHAPAPVPAPAQKNDRNYLSFFALALAVVALVVGLSTTLSSDSDNDGGASTKTTVLIVSATCALIGMALAAFVWLRCHPTLRVCCGRQRALYSHLNDMVLGLSMLLFVAAWFSVPLAWAGGDGDLSWIPWVQVVLSTLALVAAVCFAKFALPKVTDISPPVLQRGGPILWFCLVISSCCVTWIGMAVWSSLDAAVDRSAVLGLAVLSSAVSLAIGFLSNQGFAYAGAIASVFITPLAWQIGLDAGGLSDNGNPSVVFFVLCLVHALYLTFNVGNVRLVWHNVASGFVFALNSAFTIVAVARHWSFDIFGLTSPWHSGTAPVMAFALLAYVPAYMLKRGAVLLPPFVLLSGVAFTFPSSIGVWLLLCGLVIAFSIWAPRVYFREVDVDPSKPVMSGKIDDFFARLCVAMGVFLWGGWCAASYVQSDSTEETLTLCLAMPFYLVASAFLFRRALQQHLHAAARDPVISSHSRSSILSWGTGLFLFITACSRFSLPTLGTDRDYAAAFALSVFGVQCLVFLAANLATPLYSPVPTGAMALIFIFRLLSTDAEFTLEDRSLHLIAGIFLVAVYVASRFILSRHVHVHDSVRVEPHEGSDSGDEDEHKEEEVRDEPPPFNPLSAWYGLALVGLLKEVAVSAGESSLDDNYWMIPGAFGLVVCVVQILTSKNSESQPRYIGVLVGWTMLMAMLASSVTDGWSMHVVTYCVVLLVCARHVREHWAPRLVRYCLAALVVLSVCSMAIDIALCNDGACHSVDDPAWFLAPTAVLAAVTGLALLFLVHSDESSFDWHAGVTSGTALLALAAALFDRVGRGATSGWLTSAGALALACASLPSIALWKGAGGVALRPLTRQLMVSHFLSLLSAFVTFVASDQPEAQGDVLGVAMLLSGGLMAFWAHTRRLRESHAHADVQLGAVDADEEAAREASGVDAKPGSLSVPEATHATLAVVSGAILLHDSTAGIFSCVVALAILCFVHFGRYHGDMPANALALSAVLGLGIKEGTSPSIFWGDEHDNGVARFAAFVYAASLLLLAAQAVRKRSAASSTSRTAIPWFLAVMLTAFMLSSPTDGWLPFFTNLLLLILAARSRSLAAFCAMIVPMGVSTGVVLVLQEEDGNGVVPFNDDLRASVAMSFSVISLLTSFALFASGGLTGAVFMSMFERPSKSMHEFLSTAATLTGAVGTVIPAIVALGANYVRAVQLRRWYAFQLMPFAAAALYIPQILMNADSSDITASTVLSGFGAVLILASALNVAVVSRLDAANPFFWTELVQRVGDAPQGRAHGVPEGKYSAMGSTMLRNTFAYQLFGAFFVMSPCFGTDCDGARAWTFPVFALLLGLLSFAVGVKKHINGLRIWGILCECLCITSLLILSLSSGLLITVAIIVLIMTVAQLVLSNACACLRAGQVDQDRREERVGHELPPQADQPGTLIFVLPKLLGERGRHIRLQHFGDHLLVTELIKAFDGSPGAAERAGVHVHDRIRRINDLIITPETPIAHVATELEREHDVLVYLERNPQQHDFHVNRAN